MGIFWGFVLVWFGLAYFGASLGWWDYAKASELWLYWPLILIFGGFSAILKGKKFAWAIMVALLLIATYAIYDLSFATNPVIFSSSWREKYGQEVETREESINFSRELTAEDIKYKLNVGAIEARISGNTQEAFSGLLTSSFLGLSRKSELTGKTQLITLATDGYHGRMMWFGRRAQNKLEASLNNELPVSLEVESGASDLDFDLSEYLLKNVQISTGASSIRLRVGERVFDKARVRISSGASAVGIEVPRGLGVRIKTDDGLSSNQFDNFTKDGDYYYTNEAYKIATKKLDIILSTGASSVVVKQY